MASTVIVVVTELGRSPAGASGSQLPGYIYIYRFQLLSGLSHALAVASTVIVVDGGVNEDEKSNRP